jgi:opacity protein-like surface antigen
MIRIFAAAGLCAALLASASASASVAAPTSSPLDEAFGNTIVSTYPDGRKAELYLQADGGYTAKGRRGDPSSGHWKTKGGKLCLSQSRPIPSPFSFCTPIPKTMTSSWSAKAVTGERIRVHLAQGHQ